MDLHFDLRTKQTAINLSLRVIDLASILERFVVRIRSARLTYCLYFSSVFLLSLRLAAFATACRILQTNTGKHGFGYKVRLMFRDRADRLGGGPECSTMTARVPNISVSFAATGPGDKCTLSAWVSSEGDWPAVLSERIANYCDKPLCNNTPSPTSWSRFIA